MKKLLLPIFLIPTIAFCIPADRTEEKKISKTREKLNPLTDIEDEQKRTDLNDKMNHQKLLPKTTTVTSEEKTQPTIQFDLKEFTRQDALRQQQRSLEDKQLTKRWQLEDQKEQEIRNNRSIFQKGFEKLSGVDSTATEEKNAVRSKLLFEKNKRRMHEDFKHQTEKFDALAQKHPEFRAGDGETLVRIGRMDDFITMDKENRTKLLESVQEVLNSDRLQNFSLDAMQDLVQLTHLSKTETSLPKEFESTLSTDMTPENEPALKAKLLEFLKTSINESLQSMKTYSDAIESETIQDSINDLAAIRRVKNFANNGTMVLGCAGLITMVIPGVSHLMSAVQLTAERLFIGAKALFLGAHASGGLEGHFERTLQDKYADAFQHLLPKTTKLLKTEAIKTEVTQAIETEEEKGLLSKADAALEQTELFKIGDNYKAMKSWIQSMSSSAQSGLKTLSETVSQSEFGKNARNLFRKIGTEESKSKIAHEYSMRNKPTEEEQAKIAAEEKAKVNIQRKISDLQERIKNYPKTTNTSLPVELYKLQDELLQQQRAQQDLLRKLDWQAEDIAATEQRDSQIFTERILKGASTDAGIDKEKENVRNKEIIDINRQRMQEDFATKARRFTSFVENNPEFAKKAPWNNLLKLGDMNAFVKMTPQEREQLITDIQKSMTDFFADESKTFDPTDIAAATQLVSLTNLYRPGGSTLTANVTSTLQSDLASQDPDQIKQALKEFFKTSTTSTLETLRQFSKDLDVNMDSLAKIDTAKNASFASMMVIGFAGVAVMVAGHPLVFHAVKLTLEQCAIVGKAALIGAHVSSHSQREMVREIQDKYVEIFQPLLPESTRLLQSTKFENEAKTIGQRMKEAVQGSDTYQNYVKPIVDTASTAHEKYTKPITDTIVHALTPSDRTTAALKKSATAVAQGTKKAFEPIHDAVSSAAKTAYDALPQAVKDYVNTRNAAQRQKLQKDFTVAPTATPEQPKPTPSPTSVDLQTVTPPAAE